MDKKLEETVENFKIFRSYCNHDLRSLIGVAQTSLSLFTEMNPEPKDEVEQLLHDSLASLKEALRRLDSNYDNTTPAVKILWILSPEPIHIGKHGPLVIREFKSLEAYKAATEKYKPDALFVDSKALPNTEESTFFDIGAAQIKTYLFTHSQVGKDLKALLAGTKYVSEDTQISELVNETIEEYLS